jgi:hypothetical protein
MKFLRILNRLEVGVFARAVKLESPCTYIHSGIPTYTSNSLRKVLNYCLNIIKIFIDYFDNFIPSFHIDKDVTSFLRAINTSVDYIYYSIQGDLY